jgi:ATP/maltotriose-dependent transcriptional regulator MalT
VLCEAVDAAVEAGDEIAEAVALERLADVRAKEGDREKEEVLLRRAERILAAHDAPLKLMWVRAGLAMISFYKRDLTSAKDGLTQALHLARTLGDAFAEEWLLIVSCQLALARGELAEADELLADAAAVGERIDDSVYAGWRHTRQARVALGRGNITAAVELLTSEELLDHRPESTPIETNHARRLAVLAAAGGKLDTAASLLATIGDDFREPREQTDPLLEDDLAWVAHLVGEIPVPAIGRSRSCPTSEQTRRSEPNA